MTSLGSSNFNPHDEIGGANNQSPCGKLWLLEKQLVDIQGAAK